MGAFDVTSPDWGNIRPVSVTGAATMAAGGAVSVPTSAGALTVTVHEAGIRLRIGPVARDYGILVEQPAALTATLACSEGETRIAGGDLLLVATGRIGNHDTPDLAAGGVEVGPDGIPVPTG